MIGHLRVASLARLEILRVAKRLNRVLLLHNAVTLGVLHCLDQGVVGAHGELGLILAQNSRREDLVAQQVLITHQA